MSILNRFMHYLGYEKRRSDEIPPKALPQQMPQPAPPPMTAMPAPPSPAPVAPAVPVPAGEILPLEEDDSLAALMGDAFPLELEPFSEEVPTLSETEKDSARSEREEGAERPEKDGHGEEAPQGGHPDPEQSGGGNSDAETSSHAPFTVEAEVVDDGSAPRPARFPQKRVAVCMLKGGVGKTTTVCFAATAIRQIWDRAGSRKRLLVVDADPQGSATAFFLEKTQGSGNLPLPSASTLTELFRHGDRWEPDRPLIFPTSWDGIDILPISPDAADIYPSEKDHREDRLAWFLENHARDYDLILFDTAPAATLMLKNVLRAGEQVLLPIDPSAQCLKTLAQVSETLRRYRDCHNPQLRLSGVILSRYDARQSFDREILQSLKDFLENSDIPLYEIPRKAAVATCYNYHRGVDGLSPKKDAEILNIYLKIAEDILIR